MVKNIFVQVGESIERELLGRQQTGLHKQLLDLNGGVDRRAGRARTPRTVSLPVRHRVLAHVRHSLLHTVGEHRATLQRQEQSGRLGEAERCRAFDVVATTIVTSGGGGGGCVLCSSASSIARAHPIGQFHYRSVVGVERRT